MRVMVFVKATEDSRLVRAMHTHDVYLWVKTTIPQTTIMARLR